MLPQWTPAEPSSLLDMAVQNACEGCVRETYGAALAMWQSQHSSEPDLAMALEEIAHDEIRHAQLSADIDRWLGGMQRFQSRLFDGRPLPGEWLVD